MAKPALKKKAMKNAARRAAKGDDAPTASTSALDPAMTKKQRQSAMREAKATKNAAKRKVRSGAAASTSSGGDAEGDRAAPVKGAGTVASAFAPAQAAKQAAAAIRATKKAAVIRHASRRRNSSMTTNNLSDAERRRIIASELQQMHAVSSHPSYQADPLAALEAHLSATADRLQPQTPDIGKKAVEVKHRAAKPGYAK